MSDAEQSSFNLIETGSSPIAEYRPDAPILETTAQALDLMAEASYYGAQAMILRDSQLPPAFFDLSTRLAGEMLQKFVQYRMRLAIVGDFSQYPSQPLKAFIAESNRGSQVFFLPDLTAAIQRLSQ